MKTLPLSIWPSSLRDRRAAVKSGPSGSAPCGWPRQHDMPTRVCTEQGFSRARLPGKLTQRRGGGNKSASMKVFQQVIREGITHRGTTFRDYADGEGRRGGFQDLLRVYGREGEPCTTCGEPTCQDQACRSQFFFCPRCQRD